MIVVIRIVFINIRYVLTGLISRKAHTKIQFTLFKIDIFRAARKMRREQKTLLILDIHYSS